MESEKKSCVDELMSDFKKAGELPGEFIGVFEEILPEKIIYV